MNSSILGKDIVTGDLVTIEQEQRLKGLYVIGKTGSGKTTLLVNLILQDIENGLGVCFFDTHGDAITDILKRLPSHREKDVILLDLLDTQHPFGLNLYQCDNPTDELAVQYVVDQVMHIFEKLFGVSHDTPLILEYLRNCTNTLIVNQGCTMAEIPFLLQDDESRRKLVANVTDPDVVLFWRGYEQMRLNDRNAETASILRRVREFLQPLTRPIVGQAKTTINMRQIMDDRKILLVKLDARLDAVTSLIGSVIIALLLNAAYSRKNLPFKERIQFNLYAYEFQRFATDDFATLLEEARKFGIATTIAHQFRNQLDMRNKGATLNAGNLVVYEVSGEDAEELAGQFKITPQEAWEEELEEESVEVLKEEWHERIEEEVIDGEEEITTPVSKPIDWLLSGRTHSNLAVEKFLRRWGIEDTYEVRKNVKTVSRYRADSIDAAFLDLYNNDTIRAQLIPILNNLLYLSMLAGKNGENPANIPFPIELLQVLMSEVFKKGSFKTPLDQYPQLAKSSYDNGLQLIETYVQGQHSLTERVWQNKRKSIENTIRREQEQAIIQWIDWWWNTYCSSYAIAQHGSKYYIAQPVTTAYGFTCWGFTSTVPQHNRDYKKSEEFLITGGAGTSQALEAAQEYIINSLNAKLGARTVNYTGDDSNQVSFTRQEAWFRVNNKTVQWEHKTTKVEHSFVYSIIEKMDYWVREDKVWVLAEGQQHTWYSKWDLEHAAQEATEQILDQLRLTIPVFLEQISSAKEFLRDLRGVMVVLAEQPIEDRSGSKQPRTHKQIHYLPHARLTTPHPRIAITHPKRSYADVEHEIANNLASPAEPFTARAKIGTSEYTIQALQFRQADADHIWLARQKRIIEQTQRNYCKERNYIKSEIKTRQEELMRKAQKKPQTTMDEDECLGQ